MRNATKEQTAVLGALLLIGALFGSSFLFVKVLLGDMTPSQVMAGRLTVAAAGVLLLMALRGSRPRVTGGLLASLVVLGVLDGVVPSLLIAWAEVRIDSGLAAVLVSTMPLFTVFIAGAALPEESVSPRRLAGLFAGFAGVVVLMGRGALDVTNGDTLGQLAVIGAALSLGSAGVMARVMLRNGDPLDLTGLKLAAASPVAVGVALALDGVPEVGSLSLESIGALAALGLVNTGPGRAAYFWIVKKSGSVSASLVTYIMPVSGLLLGWLVLGETIGAGTIAGMALILSGVVGVMYGDSIRIPCVAVRAFSRVGATMMRVIS